MKSNFPVAFCHNDTHGGNILKVDDKLVLIDYEYSGYNYRFNNNLFIKFLFFDLKKHKINNFRGFDIGNHFCEWMSNINYPEFPYFTYNLDLFPKKEQQLHFIRAYIKKFKENYLHNKLKTLSEKDSNVKKEDLNIENDKVLKSFYLNEEKMILEANYFVLLSHLMAIFWAVYQAKNSEILWGYFVRIHSFYSIFVVYYIKLFSI